MKLFLDTNVLIDYYAKREPFFEPMKKLRIAQVFGDVELWASIQSFSDIEYILRRAIPIEQLRKMIAESLSFINIAASTASDLAEGVASSWPDLEDFLIATNAKHIKADYLITRDKKGFSNSQVQVMSPTEWLALMESKGIIYSEVDF